MSSFVKFLMICSMCILFMVMFFRDGDKFDSICISGSTTLEPFIKKAVNEYNKKSGLEIKISAPGSISGIDALISGECDIAMSSVAIPPDQSIRAENKGVLLKSFLLGYDIIVPIVNHENPVFNISLDQLKDIYKGKIKNWSELGGSAAEIEIVSRKKNSGTYCAFCKIAGSVEETLSTVLVSNSSVLAYIAENVNAIGYISRSYINPEVKALVVEGVDIFKNENQRNAHPIKRPLYLYVDKNKFNGPVKSFIVFVLLNEQIKALFTGSNFISTETE